MNFNKLPSAKRNQLILIGVVTAAIMGGLGFGLIKWQYDNLKVLAGKQRDAQKTLAQHTDAIKHTTEIEAEYEAKRKLLADQEEGMASGGDLYSWVINTLRTFKQPYRVDIPQISQPAPPGEVNLLPDFPYKQVTVTVGGQAFFHDLGKFIADFENQFPYIRVVNLRIDQLPPQMPGDKEKLDFKMDIITLVKPNPS